MVLSIELQDNLWVYAPGETINGTVVIDKKIWNKVEGLTIRLCGRIEVGFKNDRSGLAAESRQEPEQSISRSGCTGGMRRFTSKVHPPLEDIILDHTIKLLHNWKVLKPGRHEFRFSYQLPSDLNLPSSLIVKGARIHYEFVTIVKRPRDDFKVYQTPFYISSPLGEDYVGEFEEFLNPIERRIEKTVSFMQCCPGRTINMELKLEKRLYTVGDTLSFVVNVWNELKRNLSAVRVRLVREFEYKKSPNYKTKEILCEIIGPSVTSGETQIWNGVLKIPNNTPGTSFTRRDCFQLNYFLKVVVHPMHRSSNKLSIKLPVILLPVNTFNLSALNQDNPSAPSGFRTDRHDALSPPTYEEATQGIFSEEEDSTNHLILFGVTEEDEKMNP